MQVHLKCHYCPTQAHNITYLSTPIIAETETTTKAFIIMTFGTTCKPRSIHFWRASWCSKLCKLKGSTHSMRLEDILWAMAKTWGYCWCLEGPWSSRQLWVLLLITIDQTLTEFLVGVWVCSQKSPVHSNSTGLACWHTATSTSTVTSTVTTWATATTATLTLIATTLRMCSLPLCPGQSQPHKTDANPLVRRHTTSSHPFDGLRRSWRKCQWMRQQYGCTLIQTRMWSLQGGCCWRSRGAAIQTCSRNLQLSSRISRSSIQLSRSLQTKASTSRPLPPTPSSCSTGHTLPISHCSTHGNSCPYHRCAFFSL